MKKIIFCLLISMAAVAAATAQDAPKKKQCTATTQKNKQCLNKATIGDFCHVHGKPKCGDPDSLGHQQLTGKGQACKNPVKEKGLKCWRHS